MSRATRWTAAEDALLRRLHAEGSSLAEIQQALLRTGSACQTRLQVLGLRRQVRVPCARCGKPRFAGNRLPLCRLCMGLSSARRQYGKPRHVPRTASPTPRVTICRHCGNEDLRFGCRGLCKACYYDRAIRARYPRLRETQMKQEYLEPTLPVLAAYPDHAARRKCVHGSFDAECAICERAEWARQGGVGSVEAEEEAA